MSKVRGRLRPGETEAAPESTILYVLDKATGRLLRELKVEGSSFNTGPAMTYAYQGRQYVVVASGTGPTAELVALSTSPIQP